MISELQDRRGTGPSCFDAQARRLAFAFPLVFVRHEERERGDRGQRSKAKRDVGKERKPLALVGSRLSGIVPIVLVLLKRQETKDRPRHEGRCGNASGRDHRTTDRRVFLFDGELRL